MFFLTVMTPDLVDEDINLPEKRRPRRLIKINLSLNLLFQLNVFFRVDEDVNHPEKRRPRRLIKINLPTG